MWCTWRGETTRFLQTVSTRWLYWDESGGWFSFTRQCECDLGEEEAPVFSCSLGNLFSLIQWFDCGPGRVLWVSEATEVLWLANVFIWGGRISFLFDQTFAGFFFFTNQAWISWLRIISAAIVTEIIWSILINCMWCRSQSVHFAEIHSTTYWTGSV